jgi:expansin (peptidoglycan-binding protein)
MVCKARGDALFELPSMRNASFSGRRSGSFVLLSFLLGALSGCSSVDAGIPEVGVGSGGAADGTDLGTGGSTLGTGGASSGAGGAGSGGAGPGSGGANVGSGGAGPGSGGANVGSGGAGLGSGGANVGSGGANVGSGGADVGSGGSGTGSGGADVGSGGALGTGGSGTPPSENPNLIDDFEDGDIEIPPIEGRIGFWYTFRETEGAADALPSARPLASEPESESGGYALHVTGSHINAGANNNDAAYGGIGVDLNNANTDGYQPRSTSRATYDASEFAGVRFRIRSSGPDQTIRFEVVTAEVVEGPGGTCTSGFFDAHGFDVALSSGWATVEVPFSSLTQEGWGAGVAFESSHLLGLAWNDTNSSPWDFWLDDVEFFTIPVVEPPDDVCGDSWGEESNGSVTWYTFDQGTDAIGDVNCSFGIATGTDGIGDLVNHVATGEGAYFAAINTEDYEQAATCGACVEVTRDGGPSVVATVVDQCPVATNDKCVKGHIDLSKAAFLEIGTAQEGYLGARAGLGTITWRYVSCPTTENVKFRLKEPANIYWNQVIVEHHRFPIESVDVRVNGMWVAATREEYNFWTPPGGDLGSAPYRVRATDVNGNSVEGTVTLSSGSQDSGAQLACE